MYLLKYCFQCTFFWVIRNPKFVCSSREKNKVSALASTGSRLIIFQFRVQAACHCLFIFVLKYYFLLHNYLVDRKIF